jgi:hypothetical protein
VKRNPLIDKCRKAAERGTSEAAAPADLVICEKLQAINLT